MNDPIYLVSVRLMTFNHEKYISDAMKGILMQQTNFNVEVVVGDDFSTDHTLDIIKSFSDTEKIHIKILNREKGDFYWKERQKHGRLYNFTNIIENCTGKYVALLDGDDYWTDPIKLQYQVDFLENNHAYALCFHKVNFYDVNTGKEYPNYKSFNPPGEISTVYDLAFQGNYIPSCTVLYRNCIKHFPDFFYETGIGDYPLFLLVAEVGNLYYMDKFYSTYRINAGHFYKQSEIEKLQILMDCILKMTTYFDQENPQIAVNLRTQYTNLLYKTAVASLSLNQVDEFNNFVSTIDKNLPRLLNQYKDHLINKEYTYFIKKVGMKRTIKALIKNFLERINKH